MKVGYFSDLHTEFLKPENLQKKHSHRAERIPSLEAFARMLGEAYASCDVIVAAGDIGNGEKAVGFLKMAFPSKPVIYVTGNHDYWGGEIHSTNRKIGIACQDSNIHFLRGGQTVEIDGVIFCGATLWTDYDLLGSKYAMSRAEDLMNDFYRIRIRPNSATHYNRDEETRRLKAHNLRDLHLEDVFQIKQVMKSCSEQDKPLVVVTHHAPSAHSLQYDYERDVMAGVKGYGYEDTDPFYASHLDYLMEGEDAPQVWIHGHTHIAVKYEIGLCRVRSNPKGYAEGDETGWKWGQAVQVIV